MRPLAPIPRLVATITDDDAAPVPTVPNAAVAEGNAATTDLVFQVTLPGPRATPVTFTYRTVAVTANESDYIEVGGAPLVFPPSDDGDDVAGRDQGQG